MIDHEAIDHSSKWLRSEGDWRRSVGAGVYDRSVVRHGSRLMPAAYVVGTSTVPYIGLPLALQNYIQLSRAIGVDHEACYKPSFQDRARGVHLRSARREQYDIAFEKVREVGCALANALSRSLAKWHSTTNSISCTGYSIRR